jgi:hypothetical protein
MKRTRRRGGSVFADRPAYGNGFGTANHYSLNETPIIFGQYTDHTTRGGGRNRRKRKRKKCRKLKGGGVFMDERFHFLEPVHSALGSLSYGLGEGINTLMGHGSGISPNPAIHQF